MRFIGTLMILVTCFSTTLAANPDWDQASRLKGSEEEAWKTFYAAVSSLQDKGDRKHAGKLFREVATKFPESRYAQDSRELCVFLEEMVREDAQWKEPEDFERLNLQERISYYVHHLRDVNCYQFSQPGMCYVLHGDRSMYAAAVRLKEIGKPAIPALIALLADRRPTRSVGFHRGFARSRTLLRYQDAAIQILNALLPTHFYRRSNTAAYLSNEPDDHRERVIKNINAWYSKAEGKSELETKWVAAELDVGIYPTLKLLKELSKEPGQRERVISQLHRLAKEKPSLQLPQISFLLCRLGDKSRLKEVRDGYFKKAYHTGKPQTLWDDGAASANATDYAIKQLILYGDKTYRDGLIKGMSGRKQSEADVMRKLFDLAVNRLGSLPVEYDKSEFPLYLLVSLLEVKGDSNTFMASQYPIRWCDRAAASIQVFTDLNFGFNKEDSIEERDTAIARILEWWNKKE